MATMTKEEVEQLLKERDAKNDLKIQMMMAASAANIKMTRKNRIDQEKQSYKEPADKRAAGFLMDSLFDAEDFFNVIRPLLDEEGNLKPNLLDEKDEVLRNLLSWGRLRKRKLSDEQEAYRLAKRSRYHWLTEKFYRQDEWFAKDDADPMQGEELTPEEKAKKFNRAETQARYALQNQSRFDKNKSGGFRANGKRSRWGDKPAASYTPSHSGMGAWPASGAARNEVNFTPAASFQPPREPPKCYKCGELGHMQRQCSKK